MVRDKIIKHWLLLGERMLCQEIAIFLRGTQWLPPTLLPSLLPVSSYAQLCVIPNGLSPSIKQTNQCLSPAQQIHYQTVAWCCEAAALNMDYCLDLKWTTFKVNLSHQLTQTKDSCRVCCSILHLCNPYNTVTIWFIIIYSVNLEPF